MLIPFRQCEHGFHHPPWPHSCDGCWCEGEQDQRKYGWDHDTTPQAPVSPDGWFPYGTHIDISGFLEFSEERDTSGAPLWERPLGHAYN